MQGGQVGDGDPGCNPGPDLGMPSGHDQGGIAAARSANQEDWIRVNWDRLFGIFHGAVIAVIGTLGLLDADTAAVYSIQLHLVQMALLIILGVIGMRRMNLQFRSVVREIRSSTRAEWA